MVLVIVVTAALLYLLDNILGIDIPLEVHAALLLLAGAAGSPLAAAVTQKVGVSPAIAVSTMVTVVLATIIAEPLVVALFMPEGIDISPGDVTRVILTGILIPMGIGLSIRTWWVTAADLITAPMTKISSALLTIPSPLR